MRPNSVSAAVAIALIGVGIGAVATVLLPIAGPSALLFAVLVGAMFVRRKTHPLAGGILVGFALGWINQIRLAIDRCAAFDRQPGGHCSIYGTDEQQLIAGLLAIIGVAFAAVAVARAQHGGAARSG